MKVFWILNPRRKMKKCLSFHFLFLLGLVLGFFSFKIISGSILLTSYSYPWKKRKEKKRLYNQIHNDEKKKKLNTSLPCLLWLNANPTVHGTLSSLYCRNFFIIGLICLIWDLWYWSLKRRTPCWGFLRILHSTQSFLLR